MENVQALTVGMLVSAMMRCNHGIFAPYFPDDPIGSPWGPPKVAIPKAMDKVIAIYDKVAAGATLETVTERQVAEEFTSKGFHTAASDEGYASSLDHYGLRGLAMERIAHRGSAAGNA